ncbi:restriction endonuclease subunit S [Micromonospora humida]|uniref:restriction endonuclease subunit S n=1 Tax=Micromonospora humida TaxID=2809018 RepID=UPI00366C52E9
MRLNKLTLGDALELLIDNRGKNPPFEPVGIPVVSGMSVRQGGGLDVSTSRRVSVATYKRWMPQPTQPNDVVLTSEAPLGRVAIIKSPEPLLIGQRVFCMRGRPGVLDSRFLYYSLQTELVQNELRSRATGTTVLGIRQPELRKVQIPAPEFSYQVSIAEFLGTLDNKIASNERLHLVAKEFLATLFARLGVVDDDDARETPLADLVEFNPRLTVLGGQNAVYLDMKNLPNVAMTVSEWGYRPPQGGARFQNGDVLLARITPCLENGKTGFIDFMQTGDVGIGSTEFIVMRSREGVPPAFPYFLSITSKFREYAIRHMVGSSGRQRLAWSDLANFHIRRPDEKALREFGEAAKVFFPRVKAAVEESRALRGTRDELLPLLMSGRIGLRDAEKFMEEVL